MVTEIESAIVACPACGVGNRIRRTDEGKAGRCGSCNSPLPPAYFRPVPLSDRDFDSFVAGQPAPVLAEFWAPW